MDRAAVIVQKI